MSELRRPKDATTSSGKTLFLSFAGEEFHYINLAISKNLFITIRCQRMKEKKSLPD